MKYEKGKKALWWKQGEGFIKEGVFIKEKALKLEKYFRDLGTFAIATPTNVFPETYIYRKKPQYHKHIKIIRK